MINFLHNFEPQAALFHLGPMTIYWYGLFIVLGITGALISTLWLAKYYEIKKSLIIDLAFYLIIAGIIGARIYDVFLEWPYYSQHLGDIIKIRQGGLAIHGGLIAGLIVVWWFGQRLHKINQTGFWLNFFKLTAVVTPGVALGQAIGRWGNYFNQELFGRPTNLPWGIPIDLMHRPHDYISAEYFHPTFLYESLASLLLFISLIIFNIWLTKKSNKKFKHYLWLTTSYLIGYSLIRLVLEFIRIDEAPVWLGWRWPQIVSLIIILTSITLIIGNYYYEKNRR